MEGKPGIIRRIDDLGRVTLPMEFRRELKVRDGDALEVSLISADGKKAFCLTPCTSATERIRQQLSSALAALAQHISDNCEISILEESGPIASANTRPKACIMSNWSLDGDKSHRIFTDARDHGHNGYRRIDGKEVQYYPIKSYGEVLFVLAIAGEDIGYDAAGMARAAASVLSAMLS